MTVEKHLVKAEPAASVDAALTSGITATAAGIADRLLALERNIHPECRACEQDSWWQDTALDCPGRPKGGLRSLGRREGICSFAR